MRQLLYGGFDNYSMIGDLAVIAICFTVLLLLKTSYVSRTRSLGIFINIIVVLILAAIVNTVYHMLLIINDPKLFVLVYVFRMLYQLLLFDTFCLLNLYITQISGMQHGKARIVAIVSVVLMFIIIAIDVIRTSLGYGFKIAEDGTIAQETNLFAAGYIAYIIMLAVLMYYTKNMLYKRVVYGMYGTIALSLAIRITQLIWDQNSFTTMTFMFPVIAMLYIMHSTPYNIMMGSLDVHVMEDWVRSMHERKEPFIAMSLYLSEYDDEDRDIPKEIQEQIRKFAVEYFKKAVLFQIGKGRLILVYSKRVNPNFEERIEKIMDSFYRQFGRFQKTYKIVIVESIDEISDKNEYVKLICNLERNMPLNTVKRVKQEDIDRFNRDEYILRELADIYYKHDLDDPRVLAYCQPVLNLRSNEFNTAEALMRLKLEKTGMVYPNEFISIAENNGYIHVLTEIILHKTCQSIRKLTEKGYRIDRVSVNVSVLEMKDDAFCEDILRIIENNGVSGEKIAIEITESCSESDSVIVKEKIEELRDKGLYFYLDDFGTGYSNMERLMELPFDIIKFDRSMVTASRANERSGKIVDNLAHMFKDTGFSVLFEGVEDEEDVRRCRNMFASYLQGYKYSKPIPIEEVEAFLQKTA